MSKKMVDYFGAFKDKIIAFCATMSFAFAFGVGMLSVMPAHAAIEVTEVVKEIKDTVTPIGLIGSAVLIVVVSVAAFRWVRRAISG